MKKMIFNLSFMIVLVSCNTQNTKETTSDNITADSTTIVPADSTAVLKVQNDSLPEHEQEGKNEQEEKED